MIYQIHFEKNPKPEDIQLLNDEIMALAKQKIEMKQHEFFGFFIRDKQVISVNTLDWKVLDFYKNRGLHVEMERKGKIQNDF